MDASKIVVLVLTLVTLAVLVRIELISRRNSRNAKTLAQDQQGSKSVAQPRQMN